MVVSVLVMVLFLSGKTADMRGMKPNENLMYLTLKEFIETLARTTFIFYFPPDKEHDFNYHFLAREGYITLFPGDTLVNEVTGERIKLPCQPTQYVTEKGYNFVKEYESRWRTWFCKWWKVFVSILGLIAAILGILTFIF